MFTRSARFSAGVHTGGQDSVQVFTRSATFSADVYMECKVQCADTSYDIIVLVGGTSRSVTKAFTRNASFIGSLVFAESTRKDLFWYKTMTVDRPINWSINQLILIKLFKDFNYLINRLIN